MQCKWRRKLDTDWTQCDDKIVVNQLRHFFFFFYNDAMIAALCSKSKRFTESVAKWFHDSGSSMYIFLDDLPSQTGVCLNNGKRWKIAQKQVSLLVLQYQNTEITEKHWLQPRHQCLNDPFPFEISMSLSMSSMSTTIFVVWIQIVWIDCGRHGYGRDGVGP